MGTWTKLAPEEVEAAKTQAKDELMALVGQNPEAVRVVANWMQKWFMSTGYTDLCRSLRDFADR